MGNLGTPLGHLGTLKGPLGDPSGPVWDQTGAVWDQTRAVRFLLGTLLDPFATQLNSLRTLLVWSGLVN